MGGVSCAMKKGVANVQGGREKKGIYKRNGNGESMDIKVRCEVKGDREWTG
jgi:hypothetical protein